MRMEERTVRVGAAFTFTLAAVFFRGWMMPLPSSFWLDETGTYYMISGTWAQYFERMSYAIQSPLHTTILWGVFHALGRSEWLLRLPSVAMMLLAVWLVYRLGSRLADRETGLIAATIFAATPEVCQLACQARPYAMGIAISLWAIWTFLCWLNKKTIGTALLWGLSFSLVYYTQVVFATIAVLFVVLLALAYARGAGPPPWQLSLAAFLILVLSLPITPYYLQAAYQARVYSYSGRPSVLRLLTGYPCGVLLGAAGLSFAMISIGRRRMRINSFRLDAGALELLVLWAATPILTLFVVARFTPAELFVGRYYSYGYPALALLLALGIRGLATKRTILTCTTALILVAATWGSDRWPVIGEWRAVAEALRAQAYAPDTLVLVHSGLVESRQIERLTRPGYRDILIAPFHMYPIPGRVIALPAKPDTYYDEYLRPVLTEILQERSSFYVVGSEAWANWFGTRLGTDWREEPINPQIVCFSR